MVASFKDNDFVSNYTSFKKIGISNDSKLKKNQYSRFVLCSCNFLYFRMVTYNL